MCRTSQALQFDQIERDHRRGLPDVQYIETNQINNVETNQIRGERILFFGPITNMNNIQNQNFDGI